MRPIRLELKGFTSFRDEQAVEFEGMDLFAITGPTGSGKSSLLDAMTYALYGYVERVGKGVSQLVSQGQKRMAVTLDFEVDGQRWRITRTTPAGGGSTKPLLQRAEGDDWVSAGEGADRVSEVNKKITGLVGLDYEAFTRSVLLPQGKFAEFLVGDAAKRRDILKDLLGLRLFERLAKRAGDIRKTSQIEAEAKAGMLQTEYEGVSEGAIESALGVGEAAAKREISLTEAEVIVRGIAERRSRTQRAADELAACAAELSDVAEGAGAAAARLAAIAERLPTSEAEAAQALKAADRAESEAAETRRELGAAEVAWGKPGDLHALRSRAQALPGVRANAEDAAREAAEVREALPGLETALADAELALAGAARARDEAEETAALAESRLEAARRADLAAAVRAGVRVGDPCPVCGAVVERLPESDAAAGRVAHAQEDVDVARSSAKSAASHLAEADKSRSSAQRDLAEHAAALERFTSRAADAAHQAVSLGAEIAAAFGGEAPDDPAALLTERIDRLEVLEALARDAADTIVASAKAAAEAAGSRDGLRKDLDEERVRLETQPFGALVGRARSAAGQDAAVIEAFPGLPEGGDAGSLAAAASAIAEHGRAAAASLARIAEQRGPGEDPFLREALAAVGDLVEAAPTLEELLASLGREVREVAGLVAGAALEADSLRERLTRRAALEDQVAGLRERSEHFHELSLELRADRLVAFLQLEALRLLAAAGSERLSALSAGRYRLRYQDEEFSVVDTWNGDETRAARTLSGGETFLASLALALALSDQVQALAVTQKARLESLFLDEGFGTLDPDSLEVVVEAIEQLGGDGRMIGVISHVQELAIRLPARIEVVKSPRGSTLHVVGA